MKRRDFLSTAISGAVSIPLLNDNLNDNSAFAQEKAQEKKPFSETVQLTKEIKCSRLGMGTGMRGHSRISDTVRAGWKKSIELINFAYDNGIRFYDCADLYGTHQIVAEALKGKPRDTYTLVSKIWLRSGGLPEKERLPVEETVPRFLRELRTDYIDILQIHCMTGSDWTSVFADAMEDMERIKKKGMIRSHGISSHSNDATELAAKTPWVDTVHIRINSEGMNMDGHQDNAKKRIEEGIRTTKLVHDAGKGTIAMKVLGEGKMANDAEMRKKSMQFVRDLGSGAVIMAAFEEKEHITEFINNYLS